PEDLVMNMGAGLGAKVELVEPLGNETLVHWSSPAGPLVSRITSGPVPATGESAQLAARPDGVLLFDATTGRALLEAASLAAAH
ncbi:MAG: TOBE domain-containing protein, partial [Candidatus Eisenbacteria bacterium]